MKTKLKKEHISKIETLLNINLPSKWVEETIQVSANRQAMINTGAEIFTFDQLTPLLILHFELENRQGVFEPLDLTDVRHVILGYQFDGVDGGIIEHEPFIIDVEQGIVAMIMPNQYDFSGTVYCHTFIQYLDGRSFDAGLLQMQWTKSWLDKELPQLGQLEISRFTELIMQIHTMAGIAVGELQGQLDQIIPQINSALAKAQRIENQINDNNIVRQKDFDELRESVEGIATDRIVSDSSWITVDESQEGKLTDKLVEGRTLVNLWSDNRDDFHFISTQISFGRVLDLTVTTVGTNASIRLNPNMFKLGTTYTIIADIEHLDEGVEFSPHASVGTPSNHMIPTNFIPTVHTTGRHMWTVHTRLDSGDWTGFATHAFIFPENSQGLTGRVKLSIYEGDLTKLTLNHTLPRTFASPSNLSVTSVGENLFDGEWELGTISTSGNLDSSDAVMRSVNPIRVVGEQTLFSWRETASAVRWAEYSGLPLNSSTLTRLHWSVNNIASITTQPDTRFVVIALVGVTDTQMQGNVTVNNRIQQPTPHKSTTQTLQYKNEQGEWLPIPELRGIQVNGNLLVSDEITDTEYIQRVVEVDLTDMSISGGSNDTNDNFTSIWLGTGGFADGTGGQNRVSSNRLPTLASTIVAITPNVRVLPSGNLIIDVPVGNASFGVVRQYLIDNNYQFLVPLAEPKRYPIRSWDLPSHEPVTHVHVDSGEVSPRFSFKVVTSIMPRLRKVENRLTNLENDFRNHIQTLARAIVQPIEKRDYRSVAELGFPKEFEEEDEEQEVDVNAE